MESKDLLDCVRGCLFGGAIGDAMGRPFENKLGPIKFDEHSPWQITDDTQFTLATAESIITNGKVIPEQIANQFLIWFRKGRFTSMGSSTLKAMRDLDMGGHWALSGAQGEKSAGNGAAMRIAPLAFFLNTKDFSNRQMIRDICRITHHNDEAYIGALAILMTINFKNPIDILLNLITELPDSQMRDRLIEINRLPKETLIYDVGVKFGSSGFVVESVPLAIFAAMQYKKFPLKTIFKSIIEIGGDTDTIASLAGQIIGAWMGFSNLDNKLINQLPNEKQLNQYANDLYNLIIKKQKG